MICTTTPNTLDQLSAQLDLGWDLVERGDIAGALATAKETVRTTPESPEALHFLAHVTMLSGDAPEALELFEKALEIDEDYFEAMLGAAEVLLSPLGEHERALSMCDEALSVAVDATEETDCLLLKVDILLAKGDEEAALRTLKRVKAEALTLPGQALAAGRAYFDLGKSAEAAPLLKQALTLDDHSADAHYYAGLAAEERGDEAGTVFHFLRAREIELSSPGPAWTLRGEQLRGLVESVIARRAPDVSKLASRIDVFVVDMPGPEIVADGADPFTTCVLDLPGDGQARVFVYQRNLERTAGSPDRIEEELERAFTRELEHISQVHSYGPASSRPSLGSEELQ